MILEFNLLSSVMLAIGAIMAVLAFVDLFGATVQNNRLTMVLLGRGTRAFLSVIFLMLGLAFALDLSWMQWTMPTALFFIGLFTLLLIMTIWDIISPTGHPQGFLPILFSRGERLFLSFMIFFGVMIAWGAFLPDVTLYGGLGTAAVLIAIVTKFG